MSPAGAEDYGSGRQKARFGMYFPRLFACVYSLIGQEAAAKDVVSEAFGRVLVNATNESEDAFVVELFTTARDLVRASCAPRADGGRLTSREQELLSFVFDARLTREQTRRLMGTTERTLSATLLRALRKLQAEIASPALPSVRPA